MRALLLILAVGAGSLYGGHRWLHSPGSLDFLAKRRQESWAGTGLVYLGLYRSFFGALKPALSVFDICSSEAFKSSKHHADCIYYRAFMLDQSNRMLDAINAYGVYLEQYPNHSKASLARRRVHLMEESRKL